MKSIFYFIYDRILVLDGDLRFCQMAGAAQTKILSKIREIINNILRVDIIID